MHTIVVFFVGKSCFWVCARLSNLYSSGECDTAKESNDDNGSKCNDRSNKHTLNTFKVKFNKIGNKMKLQTIAYSYVEKSAQWQLEMVFSDHHPTVPRFHIQRIDDYFIMCPMWVCFWANRKIMEIEILRKKHFMLVRSRFGTIHQQMHSQIFNLPFI